ncbi:MAG: hypothetical protein LBT19_00735 [Candidatus Nomurabacteria bacterium]|jgi:hypothetical protein|nr:hypothetical protein [Candidatus Nomurabacteria bacterium]
MTKFTIKNYLICWLRIWPITLVFVLAGLGFGVWASSSLVQSYRSGATILIVNPAENVVSTDYTTIMNSRMVSEEARKGLDDDDDDICTLLGTGVGNVLNVSADCTSSVEESERLLAGGVGAFESAVRSIYEDDTIRVTKVSGDMKAVETVTGQDYAFKIVVPVFAAMALSAIVAFIWLDYKSSESRKK